jgi:hypothetical protein
MTIIRNILAVIFGYATFAVSAVALFRFSGIDPHADPPLKVVALVVAFGLVFSFFGGWLAAWIANPKKPMVNYILAAIIAGFAAFSFFKSPGSHYSQLAAIFLFAPASFLGGWFFLKKKTKQD